MMIRRNSILTMLKEISLAAILLALPACQHRVPPEFQSFYDLSLEQQNEVFHTYPLEKQVGIFLYEWRNKHPANLGLAFDIARGGEKNVPFLLSKLTEERDEQNGEAIIYVLKVMIRGNHVQNPEEIIATVSEVVSKIKDDTVRARSIEMLETMKGSRN